MRGEPFKEAWKTWEAIRCEMDGLFRGGAQGESKPRGGEAAVPEQAPRSGPQVTIRQLMTVDPIRIRSDTPLDRALDLLIQKDLSALPVLNENDVIVGLLNERHLLMALGDPEATTVSGVMDTQPVTVGVDEPIVEVIDRLMSINVRQVLVLEAAKLVGVVTRADLMPAIIEVFRARARHA